MLLLSKACSPDRSEILSPRYLSCDVVCGDATVHFPHRSTSPVQVNHTWIQGAFQNIPDKLAYRPLRAAWDLTLTYQHSCMSDLIFTLYCTYSSSSSHCLQVVWSMLRQAIFGVIADFTCLILPMPIVWQLSLPRKDRISIIILLGLGIIACGAGVVRTVLQQEASRPQQNQQPDITWATWPFYLTVEIEINAGIVQKILSLYRSNWQQLPVLCMRPGYSSIIYIRYLSCWEQMVDAIFKNSRNQWLRGRKEISNTSFWDELDNRTPPEPTRTEVDIGTIDSVVRLWLWGKSEFLGTYGGCGMRLYWLDCGSNWCDKPTTVESYQDKNFDQQKVIYTQRNNLTQLARAQLPSPQK